MSFSQRSLFWFGNTFQDNTTAENGLSAMHCCIILDGATHPVHCVTYQPVNLPSSMLQAMIRGDQSSLVFIFNLFI